MTEVKKKPMSERERQELIKKFESGNKKPNKKQNFDKLKEDYLKQTDRNYKDGDRNWKLVNM